jgi:tetratricopeptide (TPR) repeat protein
VTLYEGKMFEMKKIIAALLILTLFSLGAWCVIYLSYIDVQNEVAKKSNIGDWAGAGEELRAFLSKRVSYPIYKFEFLKKYYIRLRYNEGVVNRKLGASEDAEMAFKDAALSAEKDIASHALYNLALCAIEKSDYETARSYLSKALVLNPSDTEAKVNFELIVTKIKRKKAGGTDIGQKDKNRRDQERQPGEQWRLDIPDQDGQSGSGSGRRYL